MKFRVSIIVVLTLLIASNEALAQKRVSRGNQQWFQYYNTLHISDKWAIQSDAGIRFRDELTDLSQALIRSGLEYQWTDNLRTTLGFALLSFHLGGVQSRAEYRPYQELDITKAYGKVRTQHRFRMEQRFFSSTDEFGIESNFNFRYRYRLMVTFPLATLKHEKKLIFNIGDEILFNSGKEIIYNVFDSNRLLIGPGFQINPDINISLLYHHLFAQQNEAETFSQTHIFWFILKHKISKNN